jgi:hypothetical protein
MTDRLKFLLNKRLVWAIAGFLVGLISLVAFRLITYKSPNVHYHANFALYINGEKDEFDSFTFYEEVQACVGDAINNPKSRVHMHNFENHAVHVHAAGVTWGHFFANLGYALGNNVVRTDKGVFVDSSNDNQLRFLLNGEYVTDIANRVIGNEDVLLIDYGRDTNSELNNRFDSIPRDAGSMNEKFDPGGCAGDEELNFWERLERAIGIDQLRKSSNSTH